MSSPSVLERFGFSVYDIVLSFWRLVINLFFREIRPRGAFNIPRTGPVLFVVAPHANQFLDPLLLMSEVSRECRRKVAFLIAAKSMDPKKAPRVIGQAARAMEAIPVERAADLAKSGSGRVHLHPEDPTILLGTGTSFTTQIKPRASITLGKLCNHASAQVEEVASDTQLKLKKEFAIDGKDENTSVSGTPKVRQQTEVEGKGGLDYKILPYIDQHDMYSAVYKRLKDGGCIGIFPEGGSHDRTDLLPLKAGVTLMALGSMSTDPNLSIKIVPVGLSYFHPHKFRSRAVVEFGAPMDVPRELVDEFGKGGKEKREACGKLLGLIYDGLKTVTLRTPDFETMMVIQAGRRLYKSPGQYLTLGQTVELNKRFIEGYLHYQHEPAVISLRSNIIKYNRLLRDLGLRDHQVERATRAGWRSLGLLFYRLGLLLAWAVLALPGVVLHAPVLTAAKIISKQKAKTALAASTVKVAGRDVISTWKVLLSLVFTPILYAFYAFVATFLSYKWGAPSAITWWMPVYVFVGLPFMAVSALKFGEAAMDVFKSLRPLTISLIPGNNEEIVKLKTMRAELSEELSGVINKFGPQLYEDFSESRLLASAVVPPSSSSSKSSGKADSQNFFSHPMSWIDEALFGWSQASKPRWAAQSKAGSSAGTPHEDQEEEINDDADYDQVIGVLRHNSGHSLSPKRPRASSGGRQQSYADVSALKRTGSSLGVAGGSSNHSSSPTSPTTLHPSHVLPETIDGGGEDGQVKHRRARKGSLSTGVPVADLREAAQHSPDKSFSELTNEVNESHLGLSGADLQGGKSKDV